MKRSPRDCRRPRTDPAAGAAAPQAPPVARLGADDDDARWRSAGLALLAAYSLVATIVVLFQHATPTYGAEGDLIGVYLPAAQALRAGHLAPEHYLFHGIGYPAMLAALGAVLNGDDWLGARVLNVAAAVTAAWLTFELARGLWSSRTGVFAVLALITTPVFLRATVEAGTDMPALAWSLGATVLICRAGGPAAMAASGFLAGVAIITRYNAVFLPLAGVATLLARPATRTRLVPYLGGLAVPVVTWFAINQRLSGAAWSNQNYANIAYEFFGRSVPWERFWLETSGQFHSFREIVAYDPRRFITHLGANLATRWWRDARELMSPWSGWLAVPGLVLMLRGRPGARAVALHAALAYGVLAFAFYSPRFFLYLLPFYLCGTVALVLETGWPPRAGLARPRPGDAPPRPDPRAVTIGRVALLATLAMVSSLGAIRDTRLALAEAPTETRAAGVWLRAHGITGRIFARKPNVAYFAGMDYVPMPNATGLSNLLAAARAERVDVLFLSPIELGTRPQFEPLAYATQPIPGLALLQSSAPTLDHAFVLFRFTGEVASDGVLDSALVTASEHYAAMPNASNRARFALAGNLINLGRAREALAPLAAAEQASPRDPLVARWQAQAHLALGDYARAAAACRRAIALGSDTAWERGQLGRSLVKLGRAGEALPLLRAAVAAEPANAEFVESLGAAYYDLGDFAAAMPSFERTLALQPGDQQALYHAARILLRNGERSRAVTLLRGARERAAFTLEALSALADSLGVAGVE